MKSLLACLLIFSTSFVSADECLKYSEKVTLQGTLSRQTFPEQPNYESIEEGDTPASYFFISPTKAFCVSAGNERKDEIAEAAILDVQLIFPDNAEGSYSALRPYLGQEVICIGSFMHWESGHHHTRVLLLEAKCNIKKS